MRELFLHVGMHKTGTTSVQRTCQANRALLAASGISYLEAREPNHSRTVFSAYAEEPHTYHVNRRDGLHEPGPAADYAARCRDLLLGFLAGAPGPRLLVSGEDIGMLSEAATARMLAEFRPLVDRIVVVGLVRPPRGYMISAAQQRIRGGSRLEDLPDGTQPRYRFRFAKFRDAPEVAELRLRPFARATLERGCAVATTLALCGAPPELYDRLAVDRANVSASRPGVALSLAANEVAPVFRPDGSANPERARRLVRFLEELDGPRFTLPETLLAPWLAEEAEDIAWMEEVLAAPLGPLDTPPAEGAGTDLRSLTWPEVQALVRGLNALFLDREAARPARAPAAMPDQRRARRRARREGARP
ncbi:MAG TPA: hypothetical protein VE684_19870 [Crenalkalicoccus sp.]|nr:hypothetical protein [Crenalkalicoccus sp.]